MVANAVTLPRAHDPLLNGWSWRGQPNLVALTFKVREMARQRGQAGWSVLLQRPACILMCGGCAQQPSAGCMLALVKRYDQVNFSRTMLEVRVHAAARPLARVPRCNSVLIPHARAAVNVWTGISLVATPGVSILCLHTATCGTARHQGHDDLNR